jgi:hypothetical protein
MSHSSWGCALGVVLTCVAHCSAEQKGITPDLARLNDPKVWSVINADWKTATEDGKSVVHMAPKGGDLPDRSNVALALVEGLEFGEGTLEIDLKGRGKQQRCFLGVAFHVVDGNTFEAVYFRPFQFMADVPLRSRAIQYVCWPDHLFQTLRQEKPGKYESAVKPVPDPGGWFHARIEVTKRKVSVWVDDGKEPCMVVDRLSSREGGKVGLFVDSREGTLSNLTIRPAK